MSYLHTHINTAEKIISNYKGIEPFHHHLKSFFKEYKKAGSKDRKNISHICYSYFRIGRALIDKSFQDRLIAALILCEPGSVYLKELLPQFQKDMDEGFFTQTEKDQGQKLITSISSYLSEEIHDFGNKEELLNQRIDSVKKIFPDFDAGQIFPFVEELSEGLDINDYSKSFLHQPDLHVRLRPGKQNLTDKLIALPGYLRHVGNSFAFKNGTNLDAVVKTDRDMIIQDWSSQQVQSFFPELSNKPAIWDACAASGGKSLLAVDHYKNPELTVTDKRSNILHNLVQRFAVAELRNYKSMVTDLSIPKPHKPAGSFDLVIADVPCSGSGTWARNPENLYYFKEMKVGEYQSLQRLILNNLFNSVKQRGYLLYITCSVFKKENEDNVDLITKNGFELVRSGIVNGALENADYMFAALLRKNN